MLETEAGDVLRSLRHAIDRAGDLLLLLWQGDRSRFAAQTGPGRVESHARMLGIFWLAYSAFRLMGGWLFARFFTRWGIFWNPDIPFFLPGLLRGLGMVMMASGVLGILAGWGLIDRQPWARILAIVRDFRVTALRRGHGAGDLYLMGASAGGVGAGV